MKTIFSKLSTFIQKNKKTLLMLTLIYVSMLLFFLITSIGTETYRLLLQARRYLICAVGVTFSIHLWKKCNLPFLKLIPCLIVSGSWFFIFNITSYLANYKSTANLNNYMDIAFAAYIFCFMTLLQLIMLKLGTKSYLFCSFGFSLFQCILLVIPVLSLLYYIYYDTAFSTTAAIAVLQTNPKEAWEYILQIGKSLTSLSIIILLIILTLFYKLNRGLISNGINNTASSITPPEKYLLGLLVIALCVYLPKSFLKTGVISSFKEAHSYLSEFKEFQKYHQTALSKLSVEKSSANFSKPSTFVLVIGESYGRNFMSAYGYTNNNTTPWLKEKVTKDETHFIRFNHAYSSFGSTVQALEQSLTEKNQYNNLQFKNSITILDLAKKAGYKTYWFSNQGVKNTADTPIQIVGKTADVHHWIENDTDASTRILYDGDLLPCLKQVDPNENNFVVIHVMGCHELTIHRFPEYRTKFGKKGVFDLIANYEDAMAYNDWVLQKIYEYGKEKLNMQAMVIFSDHGANPYRKRTAENIPFINLRIPLIIYLSDEYQSVFPDTAKALRNNRDKYYSNDLMFETIGGILNITSEHIAPEFNLANPKYHFTRNSTKTDLGRKNVVDDIHENEIEY